MPCDRLIIAKLQQLPPVGIDLGLTREVDEDAAQPNTDDAEDLTGRSARSQVLGLVLASVGHMVCHHFLRLSSGRRAMLTGGSTWPEPLHKAPAVSDA
jgi:hypothetical protein